MTNFMPANAAVWFEIPVTDIERSRVFYSSVLQTETSINEDGPNPVSVFAARDQNSVAGHLYPGNPAAAGTGTTIHLAVAAPLEAALDRVSEQGGKVVSPITQIPAGRFAYCLDPDGNSFGLFV